MGKVAENFKTTKAYVVDDLVLYDGVLYVFVSAHSAGAWNSSHVRAVDASIEQMITELVTAHNVMMDSAAFGSTVIFEPTLIEGTRYKYVLTNTADPRN